MINFLDETLKERISNVFKCSLFFSLSFIDATTSTYFFFSSSSHPLSCIHLIVHLSFVSLVVYFVRAIADLFTLLFTTFVYMSHATTPTKGPSTADCEVLTGKFIINIVIKLNQFNQG